MDASFLAFNSRVARVLSLVWGLGTVAISEQWPRAVTGQWPSSASAAKEVTIPVKIRPCALCKSLLVNQLEMEAKAGIATKRD
jgi:hypothetical protein